MRFAVLATLTLGSLLASASPPPTRVERGAPQSNIHHISPPFPPGFKPVLPPPVGRKPVSPSKLPTPTVRLDLASVEGTYDGHTHSYLGIPYAQAPVGHLRFSAPVANSPYTGKINATAFGNICYNFVSPQPPFPTWITPEQLQFLEVFDTPAPAPSSEDCLNINVITPTSAKPGSRLPVVAYIFFGAFEFGGAFDVDGRNMVKRSVELGEPVIFVSMNHRLGPLGWLGGKEIKDVKQETSVSRIREALRWIQRYIIQFGGDPTKVTLLGLSSGGVSAALQTVYNNGNTEGLFHALWAESGAIQPVGWIDAPQPQAAYNTYVASVGCSDAKDTLLCLRQAPVDAVTNVNALTSVWTPHADGSVISDLPQTLLTEGHVAKIPVVAGNAEDEGTLFALNIPDITNDMEFIELVMEAYFRNISSADAETLLQMYPNDPAQGAPYGTGDDFQYTLMHKRFASFAGDTGVDAVRRFFTQQMSAHSNVWAYYYKRFYVPGFGSTHASELPDMYQSGNLQDIFIHFANTLDPNGATNVTQNWPKYDTSNPVLLEFTRNTTPSLTNDTYREAAIEFLIEMGQKMPWPI
ncbi:alpha/beta-hydrolase [Epithele typhae]|uniref:alpha/beta-hydrolase n=1 Tax=Epithele typhae TaxID=378194 RepID=UPI002007A18F|nr:alpha/beta-hydrolase [Epithele typhae]KAH9926265.1 alpha/beta-hydrolase [Epithele typhae]